MRFQPGAVLPDHEHLTIEQTYVLEGSLIDKEGPARRASKARPANSSDASRAAATSHGVPKAG
jgi:anti-sigma factor ChrR (cupin superfamily)